MELIQWAVQFKSHAILTASQAAALAVANNFLAAYIAALFFCRSKDISYLSCALIACLFVSYSVIYDYVNGWQLMLLYCFCYSNTYRFLTGVKSRIACAIMVLFTAIMAMDAWANATVKTWLYNNYADIVACIHMLIIASCIRWQHAKRNMDILTRFMRYISARLYCYLCL